MVFILSRMGNSREALMLIIEKLRDVQRVSFNRAGKWILRFRVKKKADTLGSLDKKGN